MGNQASEILTAIVAGDDADSPRLLELVYDDLRRLAAHYLQQERVGHTLQATALVNEAYLKLIDQTRVDWRGKSHFFAVGAQAMRRVLVNHAKSKKRLKRGGQGRRVPLDEPIAVSAERDEDVLALDEALEKLAKLDPRQAKLVELRFFGGLNVEETAEVLGVSKRTVEREWTACRAWLRRELSDQDDP
jgi:RNA polymerase sigma-70 factor (ECF subfamily)